MRTFTLWILLAGLPLLAGCRGEDKSAQDYAKKLSVVLASYQDQVNQKIKAEQDAYKQLAATYARARDQDAVETLYLERSERSRKIADQLVQRGPNEPVTLSEIREMLRDYGNQDFELTRPMLEQEAAARAQYLANLEDLQLEAGKIQALTEALNELAKPKSRAQQFKDLTKFAETVNSEFNRRVCEDLAAQISSLETKAAAEADPNKKKLIQAQIDQLKDQRKRRKCQ